MFPESPRVASLSLAGMVSVSASLVVWLLAAVSAAAAEKPSSIWIMNIDGSQPRKLVHVEGYDYHRTPRWSHDGKRIAFYAANKVGFGHEAFVVNADGTGLQRITLGDFPDWSPDDKQIVSNTWKAPGWETYVQNLDGKGRQRVAEGDGSRWSPDGSHLAIRRNKMLYLVELVTSEQRALFDGTVAELRPGFCWAPDGKSLAVFAQLGANDPMQLLFVSAEGEVAGLRVRLNGLRGGVASFSPDGKQLVFDAGRLIYIVDLAGKGPPRVVPNQQGRNLDPDWSPDGKRIVFASNRD